MKCLLSLLLLILTILKQRDAQQQPPPGSISVNIIADTSPHTQARHHVLGHSHAMEFVRRIFADIKVEHKVAERKIWPPIYTNECPGVKFKDNTAFNKVHAPGFTRGLILAHRQIWDEFLWSHREVLPNVSFWESPKMIVFEDDAMEIDPRAPDMAYTAVMNMTSELLYLGHCYDRMPGAVPPECTHAYALTLEGARKLLANLDWCARAYGGALDSQMKALAGAMNVLSWSAVPASCPYDICDHHIWNQSFYAGFTVQWGNQAGGLFHQVEFEDFGTLVEDGVFMAKWPSKSVFLWRNSSFHEFPNIQTFGAMGCARSLGCFDLEQVVVVPDFQLKQHPGEPVPSIYTPCSCKHSGGGSSSGGGRECTAEGSTLLLDGLRDCTLP